MVVQYGVCCCSGCSYGRQINLKLGISNSRDDGEPENDTVPDVATEAGSNEDAEQGKSQSQTTCPVPSLMTEYIIPHTQLELGQSIACATYPYSDPHYGNMMAANGAPPFACIPTHDVLLFKGLVSRIV